MWETENKIKKKMRCSSSGKRVIGEQGIWARRQEIKVRPLMGSDREGQSRVGRLRWRKRDEVM
jgi:hypothetical protein